MGFCYKNNIIELERNFTYEANVEEGKFEEILREDINNEKFIIQLKFNESNVIKVIKPIIKIDVIHVDTIGSTLPASKEYIDQGNTFPFIYNTIIQTAGVGKGNRKWAGGIVGNLYTSIGIPLNLINSDLKESKILVKITSISIIQQLNNYAKNQFFLKYPNDILCKDKCKFGGILAQKYKDFYIIEFEINIVDKPEQDQIKSDELSPCYVKAHLPDDIDPPTSLNLSIEIIKYILYNLNLTIEQIDSLFIRYLIKNE